MKPRINFSDIRDQQFELAKRVIVDDRISLENIKYVAGFDVAYVGRQVVVAAVVMDFQTLKILEKKHIVVDQEMNYVPGLQAFRDGPAICQLYYDLEYEPDVIVIPSAGIAHPGLAGPATFIGVELAKPTIGCAKSLFEAKVDGENVICEDEIRGKTFKTKEHANELYVSPGHMLSIDTSVEILKKAIVPPHKLPEMLHVARKVAKRAGDDLRNGNVSKQEEIAEIESQE